MPFRDTLIRATFETVALSGMSGLIRERSACLGVIFTLHRVLPERPAPFSPNSILQVRPDFLEYTIGRVRRLGFDTVSMDEGIRRMESNRSERPFIVFTFDDAYRDNLVHALPILRRLACPFTLYVPTALVDGTGEIWWQALEDIIAGEPAVSFSRDGRTERLETRTVAEKQRAYDALYWRMRRLPEDRRLDLLHDLAGRYGLDLGAQCRRLIMNWEELATFAEEPLCTIGAHTVHHYELAKLAPEVARAEITDSVRVLTEHLETAPRHLSYPIGGPLSAGSREYAMAAELGLRSAVTTRPGGLYTCGRTQLHALPRISLNGRFQAHRYVDVLATGAIFSRLPARRREALGVPVPG